MILVEVGVEVECPGEGGEDEMHPCAWPSWTEEIATLTNDWAYLWGAMVGEVAASIARVDGIKSL